VESWARLRAARGGGMGGVGPMIMPLSGGYCEQPALAIEAFALFDHWTTEGRSDATAD